MKSIKVYSVVAEWDNPEWRVIEHRLMQLLHSEDSFIVMLDTSGEDSFIQTCVNRNAGNDGLYFVEVRVPINAIDNRFKHYQLSTDDVTQVVRDFKSFFDNQTVDVSSYDDVTVEITA